MLSKILGIRSALLLLILLFCNTTTQAKALIARNGGAAPRLPYGTTIFNSSQLPQILARKTDLNGDTRSIDTIRNKLALYAFAIDGKQFQVLDQIFTSDATANYSAPLGILSPLSNITATLEQAQSKVSRSQHNIDGPFVEIMDQHNAFSVAYYRSIQWGVGDYETETISSYGQYQDSWFRQNPKTQDWLIVRRNLVYTAPPIGNLSIFD